ncbi:CPBP family intramembrane glutamic endopeptidase [Myroides sp. LJL116]
MKQTIPVNGEDLNKTYTKDKVALAIVFFTGLVILISFIADKIMDYFELTKEQINAPEFTSLGQEIFVSVLLAPLVETLLFQVLIYGIVKKVLKNVESYGFIITYLAASCLLFALGHKYSIYYQIITFFFGLVFSLSYLYFKKASRYPITCVVVIHTLYNLFTTVMDHIG